MLKIGIEEDEMYKKFYLFETYSKKTKERWYIEVCVYDTGANVVIEILKTPQYHYGKHTAIGDYPAVFTTARSVEAALDNLKHFVKPADIVPGFAQEFAEMAFSLAVQLGECEQGALDNLLDAYLDCDNREEPYKKLSEARARLKYHLPHIFKSWRGFL